MEEKVLVGVGASLLVLVFLSKVISYATRPRVKLPPGPWTLPLIGSIHHLVSWSESMHSVMRKLAWKHGPVMQLWFGEVALLVASSSETAQEILKNQDVTFADRHMTSTTAVFSFDGRDIVMGPYGERWRHLRKMMTQELLTAPRVRSFRRIRQEEVARLVGEVSAAAAAGAAVNLTEMGAKLINDIVLRCSVGSRCKYSEEYLEALHAMARETSGLSVADLFPSSKLASMVATVPRKALANRKKMERIIEQIIQERKDQIKADMMSGNVGDQTAAESKSCSLDVLLRLQKESTTPLPVTNEVILVLLMDIFAGGSETSSTTLTWTLAELIRSPRIMAKAQAEMRQAFQGKDTITEDDIAQLSYLRMVIKESLRLHCPVPFLIPRKCRETCKIMGYDVPKGTAVFVNVWSICRDSKYWEDAEEFKPERFENNNIEYKGSNFEYLPFGSGRRICPGINLGLANVEVALANLLYHFDWKLPNGMLHKDLDIREARGLIAAKRTDLNVCPITHIASS